jgi:holo-[acyl-carrier protein] synthase
MMKGIGIDIIEISRIKGAVERHGEEFLKKVYTDKEISYCTKRNAYRFPELAVRFSAKEAYSKALGIGITGFGRNNHGMKWKEIEVVNNSLGKPSIAVKGKISDKVQVSLSHSRDYAVATVYIEE